MEDMTLKAFYKKEGYENGVKCSLRKFIQTFSMHLGSSTMCTKIILFTLSRICQTEHFERM